MNDIDKMPTKCQYCPYWELATYPWCCGDCKEIMNPKNGEYIKRIDAKRALTALSADLDAETVQRCIEAMNNLKAADVEPKRKTGRWKRIQWVKDEDWQEGGYWILRCSECVMPYHNPTLYCPHCGAKMLPEPPKEDA